MWMIVDGSGGNWEELMGWELSRCRVGEGAWMDGSSARLVLEANSTKPQSQNRAAQISCNDSGHRIYAMLLVNSTIVFATPVVFVHCAVMTSYR